MSTPDDLHEQLLQACVEGAHRALYERCDDGVQAAETSRLADDAPLLEDLTYPAVSVTAERSDGAPGAVCLCTSAAGARALAIRSLDPLPPEANEEPLGDGDLEAAREWGAEVMAAVAAAAAEILDGPFSLAAPTPTVLAAADAAPTRDPDAPVVMRASLPVHGEPCVLLLSLAGGQSDRPSAPAAPAAAAPPDAPADPAAATGAGPIVSESDVGEDAAAGALPAVDLSGALSGTRVPVWAELGHVRLPLRRAIDLPVGEVIEFECEADAPVELYVNGLRFAEGQLVITADGEWALRIDDIDASVAAQW